LRDAQERYLALFNAIDQGFCTIELAFDEQGTAIDYRFLEVSPSFERQTGIADGAGRWMREIAPDQNQFWFDTYGRVAQTGEPAHFESFSTPLDRWWDVYAFPISGERRVALLFRDISSQKRASEQLRESEARFREFGEAASDALRIADAKTGHLEYLSPAFERIWGEPRARVLRDIGRWAEFLHPDDRETGLSGMPRLLAGERVTNEYRIVRPDGEVRWILDVGFPVLDHSGRVVRVAGIAQDLTERRVAEEALRKSEQRLRELNATLERRVAERTAELSESERRFRGIFDSALQFMALLTPTGTVVEVNRTALAWSEITTDEIVGKPFWLAAPMRDDPALQASIQACVERAAAGETVREEHEMRGAGDARAIIDFSVKPVPGEGGKMLWLVAEGRDITELKQAQEALRQAQKMESMGQLTGGVAHDFNDLLTPIIGSLDMSVRRGVGNDRERRLVAGALQSAERAKTLVQRLLAFARRQPLQPTPVDLHTVIDGLAGLIESTLGPHITVNVRLAAELPPVSADPNQLEMALLNLAVNARDAMPEGGVLTIEARRESVGTGQRSPLRQGHYVLIRVSDTGVGMDKATVARAVEPFFSTKGIGRGTGLGLSMVHGLAAQLGGGLTIDSAPGRGTTVELGLPVSLAPIEAAESAATAPHERRERGTALLVDDEELVRMSTADMLMDLGFEVIETRSAEDSLRMVEQRGMPDVLVTDHLMPGMTGADLARTLRAKAADLPVLIVSGYAEATASRPICRASPSRSAMRSWRRRSRR
jgi:PAS domain S-box-containing protein